MTSLMRWLLRWVKPDLQVAHISQVPLEELWAKGIRVLFVDLDNTLIGWGETEVSEAVREWLMRAKGMGFHIVIVSNAGRQRRVTRIAERLGIIGFAGAWKPSGSCFADIWQRLGCRQRKPP
jgi:Predicted hydrolase of the HAD superfamily